MVHVRINEREANPNPHVNFISQLPMPGATSPYSEDDARELLRALAAQVKPIMKKHGFAVNSLEEYEFNSVFAGRNWEAGEVVELVLRRPDGSFNSMRMLMSTFCHELAHIKHMNHGPDFQKLWARLRREVQALQDQGYFGDGLWSSGTRLADSTRVGGQGIEEEDLPEYICGGAQSRARPKSLGRRRRRGPRREAGPSNQTGRQTERRRKAGGRVTGAGKFVGEGLALNAEIDGDDEKKKGSGFRKQAGSKKARDERLAAIEKRMRALQGGNDQVKTEPSPNPQQDEDSGSETESDEFDNNNAGGEKETDDARRQTMRDTMKDDELQSMRNSMRDFLAGDTSTPSSSKNKQRMKSAAARTRQYSGDDVIELSSDTEDDTENEDLDGKRAHGCDLPTSTNPVAGGSTLADDRLAEENRPAKRPRLRSRSPSATMKEPKASGRHSALGLGRMAQEEITLRKREGLGLTGERKLGAASPFAKPDASEGGAKALDKRKAPPSSAFVDGTTWACEICTL